MSRLAARVLALPHGPPMRLLHGGSGAPLVWLHSLRPPRAHDAVLEALAERFELFAPAAPGCGGLEELAELPTVHDLALHYDGALEALGLERAILAGHGFGGMIAAELAALSPARVRGLVLVAPLGLWNDAHPIEDLFARAQPEAEALLWRGCVAGPSPPPEDEDAVERGLALARALGAVAHYAWPIPDRGLERRLWRIRAPTLLMFADADALTPAAYAGDFAERLSRPEVRLLNGGHMAPYDQPAGFAEALAAFAAAID